MHPLVQLTNKASRIVLGIMSGTSADGIDVALCRIEGYGLRSKIEQVGFYFEPYPTEVRSEILRLAQGQSARSEDFCKINFLLGHLYAEAAIKACQHLKVDPKTIDLIGSHGQTLWHVPQVEEYLGHSFKSTLQLGEFSVLAERFACPVVGDFRVRDVAAGGLGAPLVPYSEFLIYRSQKECIGLQNIGGIGNITCLPPNCQLEDVFAFDTGPGNMVIDAVYEILTKGQVHFDEGGQFAGGGRIDQGLLAHMMADEYVRRKPPKTTGREYYGPDYVRGIMAYADQKDIKAKDLMATVTAFTGQAIAYNIDHYFPMAPDRLIIGGGGSKNKTLLAYLQAALPKCQVVTNEQVGFNSDAKEAVAFAVLANEAICATYNNVPRVTGANHYVVMGKISF